MSKKIVTAALPANSRRRKVVKKILVTLGLSSNITIGYYNTWYNQQAKHPKLAAISPQILSKGPLISIVVPAYNTPRRYLDELVYSVISQFYENWELILVNASNESQAAADIDACSQKDGRIRSIRVKNRGISANTNEGIRAAKGTFVAFCDHDDVLDPAALYEVAQQIVDEDAELIYTDEDKISDNGEVYFDPHFKPDWSPDLLTHVNYINHLTVIKKSLIEKAGLLKPESDGAQDYDLLLRVTDLEPKIVHVPKVLYHWRAAQNSTAADFSSKKNITDAAKNALELHFKRLGVNVTVKPKDNRPGFYELLFKPPKAVSVIVTPFASDALLRLYLGLLVDHTDATNTRVEFILPEAVQIEAHEKGPVTKTVAVTETFLTDAVKAAAHENVVIISQIALPQTKDWLQLLCAPLQLDHTKTVAPLIVRDGNIIEDCGLVKEVTGNLLPLFRDQPAQNNQTFFGNTDWVRNVDAISGGIVALRATELADFLTTAKPAQARGLLQQFSSAETKTKRYNTIFAEVVLDNQSIRLAPPDARPSFFNPNLLAVGKDYEPYTPEAAAINILTQIADHEEHP